MLFLSSIARANFVLKPPAQAKNITIADPLYVLGFKAGTEGGTEEVPLLQGFVHTSGVS